jgi:hypothetical protein
MWVGGVFWLDDTARALEARQGVTLGSAFGRGFGLRWLSRWADAMALETGMTPGAIKRRLLVFPVGIALIQRAVNRVPALPRATASLPGGQ